jgi:hypothetical protein
MKKLTTAKVKPYQVPGIPSEGTPTRAIIRPSTVKVGVDEGVGTNKHQPRVKNGK